MKTGHCCYKFLFMKQRVRLSVRFIKSIGTIHEFKAEQKRISVCVVKKVCYVKQLICIQYRFINGRYLDHNSSSIVAMSPDT